MNDLSSSRLNYTKLSQRLLPVFHTLATDEHVRRYLLDGEIVDLNWCRQQLVDSDDLFAEDGVGIWITTLKESQSPIGFCGFIRFPETGTEPQLLYALRTEWTGNGCATEMAEALVQYAAEQTSLGVVHSAVDEPNRASARVLEKVGFEMSGTLPGAFGQILQYRRVLAR